MRKKCNAWQCVFAVLLVGAVAYRFLYLSDGNIVPFESLLRISELGYKAILWSFAEKALPFAIAGVFLPLAFPAVDRGYKSALAGLAAGILMGIAKLILGFPFDTEEVLLASLGVAIGFSVFAIVVSLLKSKSVQRYPRRTGTYSALFLLVIYLACMGMLLIDTGTQFVPLNLFVPDQPLPATILVSADLENSPSKATVYNAISVKSTDEAARLAKELGLDGQVETEGESATIKSGGKELSVSVTGEWSYYDEIAASMSLGQMPPDENQASELAKVYIQKLMPTTNEKVLTEIKRSATGEDQEGTTLVAYETHVDGMRVRGSGELTVTIGAGGSLVEIHKYAKDFTAFKKVRIISAKDAYARIQNGGVSHTLFSSAQSAELTACTMAYWQEEVRGYLQPIWLFSGVAVLDSGEQTTFEVFVPAMK